jgi:hypothetical protein
MSSPDICSRIERRLSHYLLLHPLNLRHIVVQNLLLAATIPFDGYARPILFNDGALIGWIVLPANAVERLEKSGLVAGHLPDFRVTTRSTRFISWWAVKLSWPSSHFMVTYLIFIAVTVPQSDLSPLKQTRAPTFSCLDCVGVIYRTPFIQTAPTSSRQTAKLLASAGEDSRCLR